MQQPQPVEDHGREFVNAVSLMHNTKAVQKIRIVTAALTGASAGILGLTNLTGFAFYIIVCILVSLALFGITGGSLSQFFRTPTAALTDGIAGNLLSYVFWWTFIYGIVHVY
eukprot:CFRG1939T1